MKVTSQQVKELQRRVDVTYEEAERILLKVGGDIDKAEHHFNRKRRSGLSKVMDEAGRIYRELITYFLKITRKDKTVLDLPLIIVVGLFLIMTVDSKIWVSIVGIGIILISESTVNIYKVEKEEERIIKNDPIADEAPMAPKASEEQPASASVEGMSTETVNDDNSNEPAKKDNDDDYYEITIEK